jgi:hypothetical protein
MKPDDPRLKNLKNFQKGQSGNPSGKPKGTKHVKTIIKKYLSAAVDGVNPLDGTSGPLTAQERIVLSAIVKALEGDDRAREDLLNRVYGKPKETIDQTMKGKIKIEIDYV